MTFADCLLGAHAIRVFGMTYKKNKVLGFFLCQKSGGNGRRAERVYGEGRGGVHHGEGKPFESFENDQTEIVSC